MIERNLLLNEMKLRGFSRLISTEVNHLLPRFENPTRRYSEKTINTFILFQKRMIPYWELLSIMH
ncbi:MAG: hypothetical protein ABIH34_05910 [Nanoarchaeota archaeon]